MSPHSNEKLLSKAVEVLKQGGLVIFPTDTAFGIGCRIDLPKSVRKLFKVRQRSEVQAVPILVDSLTMTQHYLYPLKPEVKNLIKKHWPGALTIVYPCQTGKVPSLVRGGGKTLGVRMPQHEIPLYLIKNLGVPLLGTSANFHGQPTPYQFADLDKNILKLVDLVIPGECQVGLASTVIDCSTQPWQLIRQGSVKLIF